MTTRLAHLAVGSCAVLLLAACASPSAPDPTSAASSPDTSSMNGSGSAEDHTMPDGSMMSDAEMREMAATESPDDSHEHDSGTEAESAPAPGAVTRRGDGPSVAAAMICSLEIAESVQRTFALPRVPTATDGWEGQTYTCTYQLPSSTVALSVQDLDRGQGGRSWFDALGRRLEGARPLEGLQNLGFPAVETPGSVGSVAFLKDHKTLWVDAGDVATQDLPPGFNRTGSAYSVASQVIACWKE